MFEGFFAQEPQHGLAYESREDAYPSALLIHLADTTTLSDPADHFFGMVSGGAGVLRTPEGAFPLRPEMYFSSPGGFRVEGEVQVAIFQRRGYRGLFMVGGPAEKSGRLCYIDHCRTTILCPPPRNGDPCLNLLTFPPRIKQSVHIHPTLRLGMVLSGDGDCVLDGGRKALRPGLVFAIEPGIRHCFESGPNGLRVVAYHPDSDGGPTDDSHPMLNRTYRQ